MSIKLGVIMDPIGSINLKKDSSLAMLLEAQQRGWELYYMQASDLSLLQNRTWASMQKLNL
ncbi:MAG: glutathione synthase, partial [Gammaproteobacteria bacterium]|nr:glutathione synthase [Gammaproteobacteria bacterium]